MCVAAWQEMGVVIRWNGWDGKWKLLGKSLGNKSN